MTIWKVLIATITLVLSLTANAVPITYNYVGADFETPHPVGIPDGVTNITASFTVDLGADLINAVAAVTDWTFSDGFTTIAESTTDYAITFARFSTDALAHILEMQINVGWTPSNATHLLPIGANGEMAIAVNGPDTQDVATTFYCTATDPPSGGQCSLGTLFATLEPGILTIATSTVPEPGTLSLLVGGLVLLSWRRRRTA